MPSVRNGPSQLGFFFGAGAGGGVGSAALGGAADNFGAGGGPSDVLTVHDGSATDHLIVHIHDEFTVLLRTHVGQQVTEIRRI